MKHVIGCNDADGGGTIVHAEVAARNAALKQATGIEAEYSADDVMAFFGDGDDEGDEDGELNLHEFLTDAAGEDGIFSEEDIPALEALAARMAALPGGAASAKQQPGDEQAKAKQNKRAEKTKQAKKEEGAQ